MRLPLEGQRTISGLPGDVLRVLCHWTPTFFKKKKKHNPEANEGVEGL